MKKTIFWDLQGTLGGNAIGDITSFEFYPFSLETLKTQQYLLRKGSEICISQY